MPGDNTTTQVSDNADMTTQRSSYPCNTCSMIFDTNEAQRAHMHEDWHITNLKRRLEGLPALLQEQISGPTPGRSHVPTRRLHPQRSKTRLMNVDELEAISKEITELKLSEKRSAVTCLFCDLQLKDSTSNVEHMGAAHSLFIPLKEQLIDLDSFLEYLGTIIFDFHECIYCGTEKDDSRAVQAHMRDMGHCMLNLGQGSELLEFWDTIESEDEATEYKSPVSTPDIQLRLSSRSVITSRAGDVKSSIARHRTARYRVKSSGYMLSRGPDNTASDPVPKSVPERKVAARDAMGLVGILDSQKRALQLAGRKMQSRAAITKAAQRHAIEQQPIKGKYYKTEAPIYQAG